MMTHLDSYRKDLLSNPVRTSLLKEDLSQPSAEPLTLEVQRNLQANEREDNFTTNFFMCKAVFNESFTSSESKLHTLLFYLNLASYTYDTVVVAAHLFERIVALLARRELTAQELRYFKIFCRLAMDVIYSYVQRGSVRRRYSVFPSIVHLEGVIAILQCYNLAFERRLGVVTDYLVKHRVHFHNCIQYFVKTGLETFSTSVMVKYYRGKKNEGSMGAACEKLDVFFNLLSTCCKNLGIEFSGSSVCSLNSLHTMSEVPEPERDPYVQYVILRKVFDTASRL